jgi:hypothetical protein
MLVALTRVVGSRHPRRHPAAGARLVARLPRARRAVPCVPLRVSVAVPDRLPLSVDAALEEVADCAGTQFDPLLARACVHVWAMQTTIAV